MLNLKTIKESLKKVSIKPALLAGLGISFITTNIAQPVMANPEISTQIPKDREFRDCVLIEIGYNPNTNPPSVSTSYDCTSVGGVKPVSSLGARPISKLHGFTEYIKKNKLQSIDDARRVVMSGLGVIKMWVNVDGEVVKDFIIPIGETRFTVSDNKGAWVNPNFK